MSALVFACPGNEALATALIASNGLREGVFALHQFPDGESFVRVDSDVKDQDVVISCTLDRPNAKVLPLYFLTRTLRDLGAKRIWLVAPYLAYLRQDQRFHAGEGISARQFAAWLSSFVDGILTVAPHLHRIHSLREIYAIQTHAVAATPAISAWIKRNVKSPLLIGPDSESRQWVSDVARDAGCPFIVLEKQRFGDTSVKIAIPNIEQYGGLSPVLLDDIISTGHTMIEAARLLALKAAPPPICLGVHAIFAGDAHEKLTEAGVASVVTCNTIAHSTNAIDIYPVIARDLKQLLSRVGDRAR